MYDFVLFICEENRSGKINNNEKKTLHREEKKRRFFNNQ